jgi:hypothetical protein
MSYKERRVEVAEPEEFPREETAQESEPATHEPTLSAALIRDLTGLVPRMRSGQSGVVMAAGATAVFDDPFGPDDPGQLYEHNGPPNSVADALAQVESAAQHWYPADLAELAEQIGRGDPAGELSGLVLHVAAATRAPAVLTELATTLLAGKRRDLAATLLAAVVRRRLPGDVAQLFAELDATRQPDLTGLLTDALAADDGRVFVVLRLRAAGRAGLADRIADRLAGVLGPADLARFLESTRDYADTASAAAATHSLLNQGPAAVAAVIGELHGGAAYSAADPEGNASHLVDEALATLGAADLFLLATFLSAGSWQAGADRIWREVVTGMGSDALVAKLSSSLDISGNAGWAMDALRKAAETFAVDSVARLASEVEGKINVVIDGTPRTGYDAVLDTVATARTVGDVFDIAADLSGRGYGRVTRDLLARLAKVVPRRRDGDQVAEYIHRTLTAAGNPKPSGLFRRPPDWLDSLLKSVARERDPEQLMALIAGLTVRGRYDDWHTPLESAVAEQYGGALIATLPTIRRRDYLPAVLQLAVTAFRTPKWTKPADFPLVVLALKEVGVNSPDLRTLLFYAGGRRTLDYDEIRRALLGAGLTAEANWVLEARRQDPPEPNFLR